jgi:hypothetical protein
MEDDKKKLVKEVRQMYRDEIYKFRKEKERDLHNICLELGGHDFWPQQRILRECVDTELNHFVEVRECSCCGFTEERNVEQEVVVDLSEHEKEIQKKGITESLRKMGLIYKE